ncbi:MAG: PEP/pyruvate-binding domain-containing protein [Eubacteriales bacterium]
MTNMGTKAQTLCRIIEEVKSVRVLPSLIITINEYENHKNGTIEKIQEYFKESLLIVRSSTSKEDSQEASFAGHYQSVLNVEKCNKQQLELAINEVISSYESQGDEEVLIQPMLENIQFAGVIFTADIDTLASYYVLNYEEGGGSEGITSGCGADFKTKVIYKKNNPIKEKEEWIATLLEQCATLEAYFENEYLDIEFGVDLNFQVTIFQVRPIANSKKEIVV